MKIDEAVSAHYAKPDLEQIVLRALARAGKDATQLSAADLAPVDEFHVGGLEATEELARQMDLKPGLHLLDVGSGIGGPARYFAAEHGCRVTGVDLTEEFVRAAAALTKRTCLDSLVEFRQGSATQMPFAAASFDRAYMIHVGMNVSGKAELYREVRRTLKPGGLFAIFDILRVSSGEVPYPVPWAHDASTSFLATPEEYRAALEDAGFTIRNERHRGPYSIEYMERMAARVAEGGPPALALHLLMGERTPLLMRNVLTAMKTKVLEPVELFAEAV